MATSDVRGLQQNYRIVFGTAGAFTTAAIGTTILRMVSKHLTKTRLRIDDYFSLIASGLFILIEVLMCNAVYVGARVKSINDPADQTYTEFIFIYGQMYFQVMASSILSILFFYRRIFVKRSIVITTTILLICTVMWWVPCTIIPIVYPNNLPQTFPGNPMQPQLHINYLNFWLGVGIAEQLILVVALILPIIAIKNLNMNIRKKTFNMIVFAVSLACIGTGIGRLGRLYRPNGRDFDPSIGDIFQNVHLGTAIMSVNLPLCWPTVSQRKKLLSMFSSSSSSKLKLTSSGGSRPTDMAEIRRPSNTMLVERRVVWPKHDTVIQDVEVGDVPQSSLAPDIDEVTHSVDEISVMRSDQSYIGSGNSVAYSRDSIMPQVHLPLDRSPRQE